MEKFEKMKNKENTPIDFLDIPLNKMALKSAWDVKNSDLQDLLNNKNNGYCRGIEVKTALDPFAPDYFDQNKKGDLYNVISTLQSWKNENSDLMQPLFLGIEFQYANYIEQDLLKEKKFFKKFHEYLKNFLQDSIYSPKDLNDWIIKYKEDIDHPCENFLDRIKKYGWTNSNKINGKIIVCLVGDNQNPYKINYINHVKDDINKALCFVDYEVSATEEIEKDALPKDLDKNTAIFSAIGGYTEDDLKFRNQYHNLRMLGGCGALRRIRLPNPKNHAQAWKDGILHMGGNILTTTNIANDKVDPQEPFLIYPEGRRSPACGKQPE